MHTPHHPLRAACLTAAALTCASLALLPGARRAEAFCGFYVSGADAQLVNNATMVVMMREGTRTVMSMQNNYEGPPQDFAMVVPVPVVLEEENVKTLPEAIFAEVDRMAAPRLVEYWEQDPCQPNVYPPEPVAMMVDESVAFDSEDDDGGDDTTVVIEAQFTVGEYEIVVLSAGESKGLDRWLRQNKYNIPDGADAALEPYVNQGMYFFVAKVDVEKVKFNAEGQAMLSPLRFHFDSEQFALPVRLGMLNAQGAQDLIVHILARGQRYQVVNRPNVTIPTNLDVTDAVRGRFGEFYAALFDQVQAKTPGAVVTEYAWDASSCDPCPGPTLNAEHFMTLGADAIEGQPQWGYVLTRLHTRYTSETFGADDLIFAAAPPITGGREVHNGAGGVEQGATAASINNFQGRYIIRHAWTGPIACQDPIRGRWGGPPGDPYGERIEPAEDTAFATRGALDLTEALAGDAEEALGFKLLEGVSNTEPRVPPKIPGGARGGSGGCASCSTSTSDTSPAPLALLALLGAAVVVARRRR